MLKIDKETQHWIEAKYPGIEASIRSREEVELPACSHCGSKNTASVACGVIGRTINIAAATTKFKLIPNGSGLGQYFCNTCDKFFNQIR